MFNVWCSLRNVVGNALITVDDMRRRAKGRKNALTNSKRWKVRKKERTEVKWTCIQWCPLFRTMLAPTFIVQRKIREPSPFSHTVSDPC